MVLSNNRVIQQKEAQVCNHLGSGNELAARCNLDLSHCIQPGGWLGIVHSQLAALPNPLPHQHVGSAEQGIVTWLTNSRSLKF